MNGRRLPDPVERVTPNAAPRRARATFDRQHFGDHGAIVLEAVDAGHSAPQDLALNPGFRFVMQMRELPVIAVDPSAAVGQRNGLVQGERQEGGFRLVRQGPDRKVLAAEREFRRLNSDEPHLAPVFEDERIAVDDFNDLAAAVDR